jgi:hypothetical protein
MARANASGAALLALGAGLLLAACSVDVEGARCTTPFGAGQCPDGQGCGNDGVCTGTAAACAAPEAHCCPEGTVGCAASAPRCAGPTIERCGGAADGADVVCGAWVAVETCGAGFECREDGGAPACLCPAAGTTVVADAAAGSAVEAEPPPTGAPSGAPACRFRSLAAALDAAAARAPGATVDAVGAFRTSLEGRALAVPAGVTLRPLAGEAAAIEVDGPVSPALALAAGAGVEDLVVRSVSASAEGDAIAATGCADATRVSIARVRVEHGAGANRLGAGLRVAAPCLVGASDLTVDGATVGLAVSEEGAPAAHADVSLTGAALRACGRGAELGLGRVTFTSSTIEDNATEGILATGAELTLAGSRVRRNGDGGLVVSSAQGLDVQDTIVCGNQAATPRGGSVARPAGGVVLGGNPPSSAPAFRGNRIFGNAGDQVLVHEAPDAAWRLDGAAEASTCAVDANAIFGYPAEPPPSASSPRGLYAAGADVSALFNAWQSTEPRTNGAPTPWDFGGRDYESSDGSIAVGTGTGTVRYCPTLPDPLPSCD